MPKAATANRFILKVKLRDIFIIVCQSGWSYIFQYLADRTHRKLVSTLRLRTVIP